MKYVLGIDVGTTGVKAILFDKESSICGVASKEIPIIFPKSDWVEQDSSIIWNAVLDTVKETLFISKVKKTQIAAIGISHQGESVMAWDCATGYSLYNNIVWQDRRTAGRCDVLKKDKAIIDGIHKKTGLYVDPFFSSTKIEWLLENNEDVKKSLRKGNLRIGTLDSWMIWNLTGGRSYKTDYTSASRTMLFNIHERNWDNDLLKLFSIPREILAEVTPSSHHFGVSDFKKFLGITAPVTGAVVDTQGALFGQACFEKGEVKNTYGTAGVIQLNIGDEPKILGNGITTTVGLSYGNQIKYAAEGIIYIAGAAVQWLRDSLGIIKNASETEAMARSVKDTLGVYFVPAFVGLAAPYWDYKTRGTIMGLTRAIRKEHIVRATLESIAYQTKDVIDVIEKETSIKVKHLKVDGGAVVNTFLMQFQADILNIPVVVPKVIETTCLGAAYLAGLKVKFWKDIEEIKSIWKEDIVYKPEMDVSKRRKLYDGWKWAVNSALHIYQ